MRFVIEKSFLDIFPQIEIGVVIARGVDNSAPSSDEVLAALRAANAGAARHLPHDSLTDNSVVAVWRDAFGKFRKRKGAHASVENLLKRAKRDNGVGSINALVDIYNAISLEHALPVGGEDLDTFVGDLRLTITKGGDAFTGFGDDDDLATLPGEAAYLDDAGAVCRCLNWRDGKRTMLTPETRNAFLVIESVDPSRSAALREATESLAERTSRWLGGSAETRYLDISTPEIEI